MASNPGLGAYIQAQKRQKQIEDQLAKAHKDDDDSKNDEDSHGGKGKDGGKGKKDEHKEDQNTVGALAKTVAKEVIGTVKAVRQPWLVQCMIKWPVDGVAVFEPYHALPNAQVTRTEDPGETMDGSVARIVQFSDSDDDEPKLKPRPAPELPPKHGDKQHGQRPEHRNVLGEQLYLRLRSMTHAKSWHQHVGSIMVDDALNIRADAPLHALRQANGLPRAWGGLGGGLEACGMRPCSSARATGACAV